jgi:hypothetical protein
MISLMEMPSRKSTIWKISPDGKEKKQITGHHENFYRHLALSPDGTWLVYAVLQDKALGLWIMPSEGGKSLPLTITQGNHNEGASWSPDGTKLAFTSTRSGSFDIWVMDIDQNKLRSYLELARMDGESITLGTYRTIHSNILNEDRLLWIHLPKEYEDTGLAYPFLILLYVDLYNYFTDAVSITEKLGETGEIPPVIIVGVANTNRYRDLLPYPTRWAPEGGKAGDFLRFLEEELIPYVDKNYRTKEFRILAAPQASAVFSLYSLINRPHLFDATIAQNPFMNPENAEKLYPMAEEFFSTASTLRHLFYVTCEKNDRPQDLEYIERFAQLPGVKATEGFRFVLDIREPTGYFIPPLPFTTALRTLFRGYQLPDEFHADSLQDILDYYGKRSADYGFPVDPPEHMLTFEGDELLQRGKTQQALDVFTYQLGLYPKSLNALFRLGETYRGIGDYKTARQYYQKFLDIRSTDAARIQQRIAEMDSLIRDQ